MICINAKACCRFKLWNKFVIMQTQYYWTMKILLNTCKDEAALLVFTLNHAEQRAWGAWQRQRRGGWESREKSRIKCVPCLAHTLLENKAGAVTTPVPCSWGRQRATVMKQLMIHILLSEVVKAMLAHTLKNSVRLHHRGWHWLISPPPCRSASCI